MINKVNPVKRQKLVDICCRYGVRDLYAFGSRAGEISAMIDNRLTSFSLPGSDVDIGVFPVHLTGWGPEKKVNLTIELEDLFQVSRVDLVFLPEAEAFLALDVIRGELLYTGDPDMQARHELFVLGRAGDLLPLKKARMEMIFEEGAR